MTGIDLPKALDAIPVVANATDRDARYPTPATNQRVYRLDTGNVERYTGSAWVVTIPGQTTGSWTPVLQGTSVAGTVTYTVQQGRWVRAGALVMVTATITTSAWSGISGFAVVTGLPYATANVTSLRHAVDVTDGTGITLGGSYSYLTGLIEPATTVIKIVKSGSAATATTITQADLAQTVALTLTATYYTDA